MVVCARNPDPARSDTAQMRSASLRARTVLADPGMDQTRRCAMDRTVTRNIHFVLCNMYTIINISTECHSHTRSNGVPPAVCTMRSECDNPHPTKEPRSPSSRVQHHVLRTYLSSRHACTEVTYRGCARCGARCTQCMELTTRPRRPAAAARPSCGPARCRASASPPSRSGRARGPARRTGTRRPWARAPGAPSCPTWRARPP